MAYEEPHNKQGETNQPGHANANRNRVEPSGVKGDNPATAGPGNTEVKSNTPENKEGQINPSAPNDSTTGPRDPNL